VANDQLADAFSLGLESRPSIAYFSMEIALEPSIPTYAGGLGVLAGDTVRAAADAGLPMVAVTLAYHHGYYEQSIDGDGRQHEHPASWSPGLRFPLAGVEAEVTLHGRPVRVQAWRVDVTGAGGAIVPVYLLDTDVSPNDPWDRTLTDTLYGGGRRYRLAQEALLGIGGKAIVDAVAAGAIDCYHINEGHAALVVSQLVREHHRDIEAVRQRCVFTTHTPVPAGHDCFTRELVDQLLEPDTIEALAWMGELSGELNMTSVALNGSRYHNAVAMRHGEVSRAMFPGHHIQAITNGVHAATWVSGAFAALFDRFLPDWRKDNFRLRQAVGIPLHDIIDTHRGCKDALFTALHSRTGVEFDPSVFTIGFARRAATYKRADLLFTDLARLRKIAAVRGQMQIVYAGKAHPHDDPGKEVIRRVHDAMQELGPAIRAVYVENYDMGFAKLLVPGVDVWLNTPRRPEEASGTSGMKAALNGVPSVSILDGWWIEGCVEGKTGWAIGTRDGSSDEDAAALYAQLEHIVPLFYHEPEHFAEVMRFAIALNGSYFTTERMVREYVVNAYREAASPRAQNPLSLS
jgi:starch phosphorylase